MKNYKDYTVEQFLNDETFIRSVLAPTEESQRYWNSLIDEGALDIYSYTEAVLLLKGWKDDLLKANGGDLQDLWLRIEEEIRGEGSASRKAKGRTLRRIFIPAVAVAAAAAALAVFLPRGPKDTQEGDVYVEPGFVLKTVAQESGNVVILSERSEMEIHGSNPDINYDRQGLVNVNDEYSEKVIAPDSLDESRDAQQVEWNRIVVPYGKMASLRLSDGSTLKINAGTTVTYPSAFSGDTREIHVDGEVFADVVHDGRPFKVHANGMEVLVKGTRFDLSAYGSDDFSHVVLVEGAVDVASGGGNVSLAPRQAFMRSGGKTFVQMVSTDLYTSWTDGVYKFENEPVENVLVKLSRFYNVSLVLPKDPSGVICYGSLELKDDLKSILSGLMQIASFNFTIKDGTYTIRWVRRQ